MTAALRVNRIESVGEPLPPSQSAALGFIVAGTDQFDRDMIRQWILDRYKGTDDAKIVFAEIEPSSDDTPFHRSLDGAFMDDAARVIIPIGIDWKAPPSRLGFHTIAGLIQRDKASAQSKTRRVQADPTSCSIVVGQPATLSALRDRYKSKTDADVDEAGFAGFIARQAVLTLDRAQRSHSADVTKLPKFVIPAIMARSEFRKDLADIAQETGASIEDVEREARACLDEIAPRPSPFYVRLMGRMMKMLCGFGYDPDIVVDEARAREIGDLVRKRPTAFLFTHKSHVDGAALIHFSHENNFPLVHMIGGINMKFFGVGSLAKRSGAIFIRRSFQDSPVYKAALRHYLAYVLEKRFPVAWSLEGTRSRVGKLMPPRYGILKYVVEAARQRGLDNLQLVPVSIYYDLIPEIESYASEQSGATKRKESIAWFIGYVAGLRKPLGRIFMDFGKPITVGGNTQGDNASDDLTLELRKLAFQSAVNINDVTPLTASGALSFVMMSAGDQALSENEIIHGLENLRQWAEARNIPLTADFHDAKKSAIRGVARAMIEVGVLKEHDGGLEPLYGISPGQNFTVSYYRNTVLHFFVTNAIIELALTKAATADHNPAAVFSDAILELRDFFKFEFFYQPTSAFIEDVGAELSRHDPDWESAVSSGGQAIDRLLEGMVPLFSYGTVKPYIEAYSIVAEALMRTDPGTEIDEKAFIATCLKLGRDAVLRQRISGEESIAKLLYTNGYNLAKQRGLLDQNDADVQAKRLKFAREIRGWQRRLRLIKSIKERRLAALDLKEEASETVVKPAIQAAQ